MRSATRAGASVLDRPAVVALLVFLVGVRFAASTATAFAGIEGIDTRGLDATFELFSDVLLVILLIVAAVSLSDQGPWQSLRPGLGVFLGLCGATVILWIGVVDPGLGVLSGGLAPWQDFALGASASLALAVLTAASARRLRGSGPSSVAREGLLAVGWGFALALFLRSLRLVDFGYLFGWPLPSGLLWALDFGPSLILSALAVLVWLRRVVLTSRTRADWSRALLPPALLAATAESAAVGVLGGFIASNALAWGGSYTVFAPTTLSLPIVGFGVGAFASTVWAVSRQIPRPSAWLIFGGIAIAALAGIQTSAGTLASFAGLVAGIACVSRGLAKLGRQGS